VSLPAAERERLRAGLEAMDQAGLDRLMLSLGLREGLGEWPRGSVEREARELLAGAPHEVQLYWSGECNCDGHLN
jgi:hypothetical protein